MRSLSNYRNLQRLRTIYPRSEVLFPRVLSTTTEDSETIPPSSDLEQAGRSLAKLAKIAQVLQETIEISAREAKQAPELLAEVQKDADTATDLIKRALDKAGRPCTLEQLSDRIDQNVVCIPTEAMGYRDYMRVESLRDDIERALVSMDVLPPKECQLDGAGKLYSKLDRKAAREKARLEEAGLSQLPAGERDEGKQKDEDIALPELRPVSELDLKRRKEHMERSTTMEFVLRGYDTALLEVGSVHKVLKGGTTMSMRALVIIGDRKGTAGYGEGKSDNAQHAIERACRDAKRNLLNISLYRGHTITHRVQGGYVKSRVTLWPAPKGSGVSANNNFSAIFQLIGLKDVGAKFHGPRSLSNAVKALFNALSNLQTEEDIRGARGLPELTRQTLPPARGVKRRTMLSL